MAIGIWILLGAWFGAVSVLVPGISLALTISVAVGLGASGINGACFIAAASGASLFTKRLALVMHPNAQSDAVASLGPVMAMVAQGDGALALDIMTYTTLQAYKILCAGGLVLGLLAYVSKGMTSEVLKAWLGALSLVLIPVWLLVTCWRSKNKRNTLIGFLVTGLYGWWIMHNPSVSGSENSTSLILVPLFGIPMCREALKTSGSHPRPLGKPRRQLEVNKDTIHAGVGVGVLAGILPGLGASSLVSMFFSCELSEETMVLLASSAESANDITALIIVLATGMTRSGEAVMLKSCLEQPNAWAILTVILAAGFGSWVGYKFIKERSQWYSDIICQYKQTTVLWFVIALSLVPIGLSGGLSVTSQLNAWGGFGCGLIIAWWCRKAHLPNQVAFGALTLPIMFNDWGVGRILGKLLLGL